MNPATINVDLSEMLSLEKPKSQTSTMQISVSENGYITRSGKLYEQVGKKIPNYTVELKYTQDYKIIAFYKADQKGIKFPKARRIKHLEFVQKVKEQGYMLPAIYITDWNETAGAWVGILNEVEERPKIKKTSKPSLNNRVK